MPFGISSFLYLLFKVRIRVLLFFSERLSGALKIYLLNDWSFWQKWLVRYAHKFVLPARLICVHKLIHDAFIDLSKTQICLLIKRDGSKFLLVIDRFIQLDKSNAFWTFVWAYCNVINWVTITLSQTARWHVTSYNFGLQLVFIRIWFYCHFSWRIMLRFLSPFCVNAIFVN